MKNLRNTAQQAFTLAEMMVVLLIMTIILAAMAPVITTRMSDTKSSQTASIWRYLDGSGNSDIYYGTKDNQRVMIGQNTSATSENARLILKTSTDLPNHILLKNETGATARLKAPANHNIGLGYLALSETTTGYGNIAVGSGVLSVNTTGYGNTGIGYYTLYKNTTGNRNTSLGEGTLFENTTGSGNNAIGQAALVHNTTGNNNNAVGYDASINNISGNYNVAFGYQAGYFNEKGSNNISIGKGACYYVKGSNKICIGSQGPADGSAQANASDNTERIYLGNLLEMHAGGNATFKNISSVLVGSAVVQTSSDRRLKNVGKEYTSSLDKIKQLKPFNFTYKDDKNKTSRVGVIAQDLQKVFPNAVSKNQDGFLSIRMEDMFYAVINAIKELDAKITALVQTVKQVQSDNYQLKKENQMLKKRLDLLESKLK